MRSPRDKVIITCAVTGNLTRPDQTPHLPITPAQIADACLGAADAGADQEDVKKYLSSGFMSQMSHTHTKKYTRSVVTDKSSVLSVDKIEDANNKHALESRFLLVTIGLNLNVGPKSLVEKIQSGMLKDFEMSNSSLLKIFSGQDKAGTNDEVKKMLIKQIEHIIKTNQDFKLLPSEKQNETIDKIESMIKDKILNSKDQKNKKGMRSIIKALCCILEVQ